LCPEKVNSSKLRVAQKLKTYMTRRKSHLVKLQRIPSRHN
jgi:hypothetical protein